MVELTIFFERTSSSQNITCLSIQLHRGLIHVDSQRPIDQNHLGNHLVIKPSLWINLLFRAKLLTPQIPKIQHSLLPTRAPSSHRPASPRQGQWCSPCTGSHPPDPVNRAKIKDSPGEKKLHLEPESADRVLLVQSRHDRLLRSFSLLSFPTNLVIKIKQEHKVSYRCSLPSPLQKGSKEWEVLIQLIHK